MKSILMRAALAASLAAALSACGGGKATFTVGGEVEGLRYPGLVLITNGQEWAVNPKSDKGETVTFSFPKQLEYGDVYEVTVKSDPAHQSCSSANYKDTAGRLSAINIIFTCSIKNYVIGGTITGLTADGLQIINGSAASPTAIAKDSTSYTLGNVTYGDTYGVSILTQPTGLRCAVANPSGTMGDAAVSNINISCVPAT